jgi:glycosyltransferase involved in cell wall biosynthesis
MENPSINNPINKLVLYTAYPWDHALVDLRVEGPARQAGITVMRGGNGPDAKPEIIKEADLVIIQRDFPRYAEAYNDVVSAARAASVPVVFDLDDLLLELPPNHPDRAINYYTEALAPMLHAIIAADAVTVSTEPLYNYLHEFNPRVWLLPNFLDDSYWQLRLEPRNDLETLTIGYIGGNTHSPDLEEIAPALKQVVQSHAGSVQLRFWGGAPPNELLDLPYVDWVELGLPYPEFAEYCSHLNCDIFIAPLQDNLFNRCKSPVKFLEYSALGVPGVYSRIAPYAGVVKHGTNGFLAGTLEDWKVHLEQLIASSELRAAMGNASRDTVRDHWLLSKNADQWPRVYADIAAGHPHTGGKLPNERVAAKMAAFHAETQAMHKSKINQLQAAILESQNQAQAFQSSTAFKLGSLLAPPGSRRERLIQRARRIFGAS